jgi:outer membrane protein OmpA-like peptidoglycan-associated protein
MQISSWIVVVALVIWVTGLSDPFHWAVCVLVSMAGLAFWIWWHRTRRASSDEEQPDTELTERGEEEGRNYLRDVVLTCLAAAMTVVAVALASALLAHTPVYAAFYDTGCVEVRQKAETLLAGGGYEYGVQLVTNRLNGKASAGCQVHLNELKARLLLAWASQPSSSERRHHLEQARAAANLARQPDLVRRIETELRAQDLETEMERMKLSITKETDRVVIRLSDLLFDSGRGSLNPEAEATIEKVAGMLNGEHRGKPVRIEGHADNTGPDAFNMWLSQQRAETVKSALIRVGVNGALITTEGYGSTRPLDNGDSAQAHARNRRVDIIVPL